MLNLQHFPLHDTSFWGYYKMLSPVPHLVSPRIVLRLGGGGYIRHAWKVNIGNTVAVRYLECSLGRTGDPPPGMSWLVLGSTQPPIQWVPGTLYLRYEALHSPPSDAEIQNVWGYTFTPPYIIMAKHRDNFTCTIHKWVGGDGILHFQPRLWGVTDTICRIIRQ
jgi:hypothetical protein